MATITNQPGQSWRERLGLTWEGWAEHRSIRGLTVWILKLAAISATLLLFFAAVVIGISTTQPTLIGPKSELMNVAGAAMSFGTDGALPGIFFLAVDAWCQGKRGRGGWLFSLVTSMLITAFISYCVAGQPDATTSYAHPLLVAKCMIALLYVMSVAHQVKQDGLNPTQVANLEQVVHDRVDQLSEQFLAAQSFQNGQILKVVETIQNIESGFQHALTESVQRLEKDFQSHLTESLSAISQELQFHAETLSVLPGLTEQLGQIEETVRVTVERQVQALPQLAERLVAQREAVPSVKAMKQPLQLPVKRNEAVSSGDFNKKQFVFGCLSEDPEMTIAEIQKRVTERGQTLSVGSISTYRKDFQSGLSVKTIESEAVGE